MLVYTFKRNLRLWYLAEEGDQFDLAGNENCSGNGIIKTLRFTT
jgi:hypothetical protein